MTERVAWMAPGVLAAIAGTALGQPVIDGVIDEDEYPPLIYVNTENPTQFGDNVPGNVPPSGDASTAESGLELVIPLSAIGDPSGDFRLGGYVASGDSTFLSNQLIGGLPNLGNLGNPPIDLGSIDMDQFITVSPTTGGTAPMLDGDLDTVYGSEQDGWLQNNFTGFGDATHGNPAGGSGSEIDAVFAWSDGTNLHLMLTGNLEANANTLWLFFDTVSGGQSTLQDNNPSFANPISDGISDVLGAQEGVSFDSGFEPDYAIVLAGSNVADDPPPDDFDLSGHYATLPTSGGGEDFFLGTAEYADSAPPTGADSGAPSISFTIDNSNVDGVTGSPPLDVPSRDDAVGSEIDGFTGFIDPATNRLYGVVTGNLETNFNKLDLFFDVDASTDDEGQNTIRADNVDVDFGAFQNMAGNEMDPGLTFDEGFNADYFLSYGNGGGPPVEHFANAAVLRTNGPLFSGSAIVDYGASDGGVKSENDPVPFDGPNIDGQDVPGEPNIYTNYAPRASTMRLLEFNSDPDNMLGDPPDPPPESNLIEATIDNSNIEGVTGSEATGAAKVTTGFEFSIDLDELGWDGESDIRIAGAIQNGGHDFMSNQVLGGIPGGTGNLEATPAVDFSTIMGDQFVTVTELEDCPPDLTGDGEVTSQDFLAFIDAFAAGSMDAEFDGEPGITTADFLAFIDAFAQGCP